MKAFSRTTPSLQRESRQGFTLVEVLLVLAVLGVLLAIAWPSLDRMYSDHMIKQAAESVRAELARTRLRAVETTLIYEFRYEQNGQRFLVVPHEPAATADPLASGTNGADGLERVLGELHPRVRVQEVQSAAFTLAAPSVPLAEWQLQGLPNTTDLSSAAWSLPILFYPDGSASSALFEVRDDRGEGRTISVRGLTGAVTTQPAEVEPRL